LAIGGIATSPLLIEASEPDNRIYVLVHNDARVALTVLQSAQTLTSAIYKPAGIDIEWVHVTVDMNTAHVPHPTLRIRLLSQTYGSKMRRHPDVLGFTPTLQGSTWF